MAEAGLVTGATLVRARGIMKRYRARLAMDAVDLDVRKGEIYGLIGPDGAGKSSLLRAIAGVLSFDQGSLHVFDVALDSERACERIKGSVGLMPQRLGYNLYGHLTVEENIDYFAGLRSIAGDELRTRKEKLLRSSRLGAFRACAMKNLSGGMRQKLGLICTLIHEPRLLVLDEPTTGIDPVSRREFWTLLNGMLEEKDITALVSTAYINEAGQFHRLSLMHDGRIVATGTPEEIRRMVPCCIVRTEARRQADALGVLSASFAQVEASGSSVRVLAESADHAAALAQVESALGGIAHGACEIGEPELEDVFIALLRRHGQAQIRPFSAARLFGAGSEGEIEHGGIAVEADRLTRSFGSFKAADQVSFQIPRGEIFGLLGANGAGKSTVIKMLTGILKPESGRGSVAGSDMLDARQQIRERIGYVSQAFSLYLDLTVAENIKLYAGIYGVAPRHAQARIDTILDLTGLRPFAEELSADLPNGFRQRLALCCALIHRPQVLFLDEPTSGVDPAGRRAFWETLFHLSREERVTILITTHFMSEAERCDRVALMHAGRVVADASPAQLKARVEAEAGTPLELLADQPRQALAALHSAGFQDAALSGSAVHLYVRAPERDVPRIHAALDAQGLNLMRMGSRSLSMDDAFVHIIGKLQDGGNLPVIQEARQ